MGVNGPKGFDGGKMRKGGGRLFVVLELGRWRPVPDNPGVLERVFGTRYGRFAVQGCD